MSLWQRIKEWLKGIVPLEPPPRPKPPSGNDKVATFLHLLNLERQDHQLLPLTFHSNLNLCAEQYAVLLDSKHQLTHFLDSTPEKRIAASGYKAGPSGEVIAEGQTTAEEVLADWLGSLEHRRILLSGEYTEIGVGVSRVYWVADLARPAGPREQAQFTIIGLPG